MHDRIDPFDRERFPDHLAPLLAGWVDGELSAADQQRLNLWLDEYPAGREQLFQQKQFSRDELGTQAEWEVSQPSALVWGERLLELHAILDIPAAKPAEPAIRPVRYAAPIKRFLSLAAGISMVSLIIFAASRGDRPPADDPKRTPVAVAKVEAEEVWPVASAADFEIISLPETAWKNMLIGEHPMGDAALTLARAEEIEIHGIAPMAEGTPRWEIPRDRPAETPMIWLPTALPTP